MTTNTGSVTVVSRLSLFLITLSFILVFTLRGGALHEVLNLSYLFAAVTFLCAFLLAGALLLRGYRPYDFPIPRVIGQNLRQPMLDKNELYLLLWAALLTVAMLLTCLYSPAEPGVFWYKALTYIVMHFLLFFFYFWGLELAVIKKLLYVIAVCSVPLLSCRQLQSYFATGSMISYPYALYSRAHGLMYCANEFAKNVTVVAFILFFFIIAERYRWPVKLLSFGGLALMVLMLVWSGSRGGFVMFFYGGFLIWLFFIHRLERRQKIASALLVLAVIAVMAFFLSGYDLFEQRFDNLLQKSASTVRIYMFKVAAENVFGGPVFNYLFGYGIEAWPSLLPFSTTPHNFIMEYLVEFGVVLGGLIMATLAFVLLYPLWKGREFMRRGIATAEEYRYLQFLFVVATANLIPGLFNISISTNVAFILFTGFYLSLFRNIRSRLFYSGGREAVKR